MSLHIYPTLRQLDLAEVKLCKYYDMILAIVIHFLRRSLKGLAENETNA